MATTALPTLSPKGWINVVADKCDMLIAHFFASNASQSQLYQSGEIANLQVQLYNNTNDILKLRSDLRSSLERYLGRYYESANVDVGDNSKWYTGGKAEIYLYATINTNGQTYVVANLIDLVDGKFEKIRRINNTGSIN